MQGNFIFNNPTKLYFGPNSLDNLNIELQNYGSNVLLVYGKNSIKKIGLYDQIILICKQAKKKITEISNVMSNPTYAKLLEGIRIAKKHKPDLILAIGGGSVIDYAKGLSASIYAKGNVWDRYWIKELEPESNCKITPIGVILTMVGTGSEMNGTSVITNEEQKLKRGKGFRNIALYPRFAILNPKFTYSVPYYQMVCGIFDIFAHICEQYFSDNDENVSDYLSLAIAKCVVKASKIAIKNPKDYEARSNLMWSSTWALNGLVKKGKSEDWNPHKIGHAISAMVDATHGATLSAIYPTYYSYILPYAPVDKYVAWATHVFNVSTVGKTKLQIAKDGIKAMKTWIKELKLPTSIKQLGVTKAMIIPMAQSVLIQKGGYKRLTIKDIINIYTKSFN